MVKCCNNVVSDVSVTGPHQNSSNQKSTPNKLPTENINFVDAVRPVYCISRVFGLMPFSIVSEPLRGILKPKIQLFDGVWFLLSIFIYISMAIITYGSLRLPQDTNRSSFVLALGDSMLLIVGLIYSALIIMFDMHNRSRLVEILNKFTAFDKEVSCFGIYYDYKKENRRAWIVCLLPIAVNLIFVAISYNVHRIALQHLTLLARLNFFGSYAVENSISVLAAKSFITLACNLRLRFLTLNNLLRNHFMNGNTMKLSIGVRKKDAIDTIKFVGRGHSFLTGIMNDMNFCYSFQMMFNTAAVFIFSVLTIYTFYRYMVQQTQFFKELAFVHFIWQFFFLCNSLMVIYVANETTKEGQNTFEIVHDILNSGYEPDLDLPLTQLSQQTQHRYPIASCGLFPFDWTLLFAMISSVTTYVTILLNFESPKSSSIDEE